MKSPKLTIEKLSRFIDNEMSEEECAEVSRKLSECPTSEQLLYRLRELTSQVSLNILTSIPEHNATNSNECLSEDDIIAIVEHKASQASLNQAERHIAGCRRCLLLVLQNIRTAISMSSNNWQELPESLLTDSRIKPVSRIKRPDHCAEHTNEQIGAIQFDLGGSKEEILQEFYKGRYTVQLFCKRISSEVASLEITFSHEDKPKSQSELTLTITPDQKQVFRALTGQNGKTLIRRVQIEDYILSFKDMNAIITIRIFNSTE